MKYLHLVVPSKRHENQPKILSKSSKKSIANDSEQIIPRNNRIQINYQNSHDGFEKIARLETEVKDLEKSSAIFFASETAALNAIICTLEYRSTILIERKMVTYTESFVKLWHKFGLKIRYIDFETSNKFATEFIPHSSLLLVASSTLYDSQPNENISSILLQTKNLGS